MKALRLPIGMGAAMGAMMVWMVHTGSLKDMAFGFIVAHIAVLIAVLAMALTAAAWTGVPVRNLLARLHRPSRNHAIAMIGAMLGVATLICTACIAGLVEMV